MFRESTIRVIDIRDRDTDFTEAQINQAKGITETQKMAFGVAEKLAMNTGPTVSHVGVQSGTNGVPASLGIVSVSSPAGDAANIVKTVFGENGRVEKEAKQIRKERLSELKEWFEDGLISEEEYAEKRKAIIDSL